MEVEDIYNFIISITNFKEMITSSKDENKKPKKKYEKNNDLSMLTKTIETSVNTPTTSISVT